MCWCPFGQPGQPWVWFPYLAMLLYLLIFAIIIWLFKYKIYIYIYIIEYTIVLHHYPIISPLQLPILSDIPSQIPSFIYYTIDIPVISHCITTFIFIPFPVLCHWYPKKQISIFFPILIYIKHQWYPIYPTRWCPPVISWFKLNPLTSSLYLP